MASVPVFRTWVAGEVVTAAYLNTNVRDSGNFFLAKPIAELRQSVAQSIANFPTATAVTFDLEDIDNDSGHSTSSNTSRYTAQTPGRFQLSGGIAFAGNATGRRWACWYLNGSVLTGSQTTFAASTGSDIAIAARTKTVLLNGTTDYVELIAQQDSGGALNTYVGSSQAQSGLVVRWLNSV